MAVSIAVAAVHLVIGLSGHETLVSFLVLEGLWMFCFGLMAGNFGALAMEPMGHIADSAASAQGFITMVVTDATWKAAQQAGWSDEQLADAFAYLGATVFTGYFLNYAQTDLDL